MTTPTRPRLAAVVVTYNRLDKLRASLTTLLSHSADEIGAIVVVDNASTEGTGSWLDSLDDPRLTVLTLTENKGGAGGFAAGFAHVAEHIDPDWLLVMDDDAAPDPGTLARFHATKRDDADGWAAAVYLPSGAISDMNRPVRNPFWSLPLFLKTILRGREATHFGPDAFASSEEHTIDVASFVGLFLSRRARRIGGLPDARMFLYGDDTLYTLGLSKAGCALKFDPTLRFTHDCESVADPDGVIRPFWRAYFYHRNQLIVYRSAAGPLLYPLIRALKMWTWRRRTRAYGAEAAMFREVLQAASRDARALGEGVTRAEIAARYPGGANP